MASDLGLGPETSGSIITAGQIGYAIGILLIVPLADKIRNRQLICLLTISASVCLAVCSQSSGKTMFMTAACLTGVFSSVVQVAVPFSASLTEPEHRGRVLGLVLGGLVSGIVLSRTTASFADQYIGWRGLYLTAAAVTLMLAVLQYRTLPEKVPAGNGESLTRILLSLPRIFLKTEGLKTWLAIASLPMTAAALFWSVVPMQLADCVLLTKSEIAVVSLCGAVSIPTVIGVGVLLDKGYGATLARLLTVVTAGAFLALAYFSDCLVSYCFAIALCDTVLIVVTAVVQRSVFLLNALQTARLNAVNVASNFAGSAAGSFVGPWIYQHWGFAAVAGVGCALLSIDFIFCLRMTDVRG